MAATLIHIKSKMLLPRPETAAGVEGEEEDPRDALVRRLLEHQKFKAAAELLHEREQLRARSGSGPTSGSPRSPATTTSRSSRSISSACSPRSRRSSQRAKQRPKVLLPPEQMSIEAAHRAAARAAVGNRGVRLRGSVRRRRRSRRPDRHVPGAARDDPAEAGARVPVGQLRPDPRLQARAAGRCAASDWRSGEHIVDEGRMAGRREGAGRAETRPTDGRGRAKQTG